jgi:tetratricopeptide (TPR) repeat protein
MTTISLTVSEAFDVALKSFYGGKLAEAEQICLRILSADPDSAATLNLLAVVHTSFGRYEAALPCYDRALALRPDFVQALSNRGAVLKKIRRYQEALESFDRALGLQADHVEVLNNRAGVLQELGRHDEALGGYDRALALRPDHPETLNNRGVTLRALGRHREALASYDAALALRPDMVEALVNRGITLHELKRFGDALADHDRAISLRPENADALSNRGNALDGLGRRDEALVSYDAALKVQADHVEALHNRGVVLHRLGRFGEALSSYDRVLALHPDYPKVLVNRGGTLRELGRCAEAVESFRRALALEPDNVDALTNRGVALHDLARQDAALDKREETLAARPGGGAGFNSHGVALRKLRRLEQALASHDAALAVQPDCVEALVNRGVVLYDLLRFDDALASYDRAIALRPDHADAHFLKALSSLVTGDFERGWIEYEWRRKAPSLRRVERDFSQPLWRGEDAIAGRTILLHSEQGFGDSIQFCRYVPLVAARDARVIVEVERPLRELVTGLAGAAQIVARGDDLPRFDLQCPLPSLPLAFKTTLATIPSADPYLRTPRHGRQDWGALLGSKRFPKIGLAWAGNAKHVRDRERSMRLADLVTLLEIDATFVSLQKDVRACDAATLAGCGLLDFGERLEDYSDTAALISQLDLVISVDTSVAHLAGALGKPVWVLLTHAPDWRWLFKRDDSPWYPSARLFRQDARREWGTVVLRVRQALIEFMGSTP